MQKPGKKDQKEMIQYINLQLAALGQPLYNYEADESSKQLNARFISLTEGLISSFREKSRLLSDHLSPVDSRIQNFIDDYLKDVDINPSYRLPTSTFILNQPGLAREVSLPANDDTFKNELVSSYRLKQAVSNQPNRSTR